MAVTTAPPDTPTTPPAGRVARFGPAERAAHWATATLMFVLFGTAAALYLPSVATLVGRRNLVKDVHVWSGLLLPLPVLLGLPARGLRLDLRRLARWDRLDKRWMRSLGQDRKAPPGKFNAGQKLFAAFIAAAGLSMLVTGSVMKWYHPFPLAWRTGATFMHDWLGLAIVAAVLGHIVKALSDPVALKSMFRGWVPAAWAARARPRWYAEMSAGGAVTAAPPGPSDGGRRRPTAGVVVGAVAVTLALGGTALALSDRRDAAPDSDPGQVAMRWEEAVDRQDYEALYDLASGALRQGSTRSQFVTVQADRLLNYVDTKGDVVEVTVASVSEGDSERATVDLRLRERSGIEVEQLVGVVREDGRWKVAEYPLSAQGPGGF